MYSNERLGSGGWTIVGRKGKQGVGEQGLCKAYFHSFAMLKKLEWIIFKVHSNLYACHAKTFHVLHLTKHKCSDTIQGHT